MIKTKNLAGAQSVTANRLRDGAVVFLRADGAWSTDVADSAVAGDADAAARLMAVATQAVADRLVVGPYLMEVSHDGGKINPLAYRERIRAFGPSIPVPTFTLRAAAQ
jgi:hypothetical protein